MKDYVISDNNVKATDNELLQLEVWWRGKKRFAICYRTYGKIEGNATECLKEMLAQIKESKTKNGKL